MSTAQVNELKRRYTDIVREIIAKSRILPDWAFTPAAKCGCGDSCSTGKTKLGPIREDIEAVRK
jgi:hypothetical protein